MTEYKVQFEFDYTGSGPSGVGLHEPRAANLRGWLSRVLGPNANASVAPRHSKNTTYQRVDDDPNLTSAQVSLWINFSDTPAPHSQFDRSVQSVEAVLKNPARSPPSIDDWATDALGEEWAATLSVIDAD